MYEFDSVSVSSYEAASLAAKLSEKSGEGWEVVSIVAAGSDIVAFLKKSSGDAAATAVADTPAATTEETAATTEPAGWGTAPAESTPTTSDSGWGSTATAAGTGAAAGSSWGSSSSPGTGSSWGSGATDTGSGWGSTAAASTPAAAAPAQSSTPSVPPGWYADPAGRYELRYWDGSAWTEHVSRAGQQYTDPPVA